MGLDQFLYKDIYIGGKYAHRKVKGGVSLKLNQKTVKIDHKDICSIRCYVAQWRKCNQIHQWFVENVQDGADDCKSYNVSPEQLKELVSLCKEVLADHSKARKLLPSCDGFFFGSQEYDEYYYSDLEHTVKQLENIDEYADYVYESSW